MQYMNRQLHSALERRREEDRADVVQRVVLIAGFTIVAILLATWLGQASLNKAADSSQCIEREKSMSYDNTDRNSINDPTSTIYACGDPSMNNMGTHAVWSWNSSTNLGQVGATFQRDSGYTSRYPGQSIWYIP